MAILLAILILASSFYMVIPRNIECNIKQGATEFSPRSKTLVFNTGRTKTVRLGIEQSRINSMTLPFEMNVFIDDRYAYVDYQKMTSLINDLETIYGFTIVSAKRDGISSYNFSYLSQFDLFALPNPSYGNLSAEEIQAIIDYINNTKGVAMIMGDKDRYINIDTLNNITSPFGVEFLYGNVTDETNYNYSYENPIAHVWANTLMAKRLGNNGTYQIKMGTSTSLNVSNSSLNGTKVWINVLAIGDDDTKFNNTIWGNNVTYLIHIAPVKGKGGAIISGATSLIRDQYWYPMYNNRDFILRCVNSSLERDLIIVSYDVPKEGVVYGEVVYINMTIKNNESYDITDIHAGIEFTGAVELLNASNYVNISLLGPGETYNVTFALRAAGASTVVLELKTWSDNTTIVGYQIRETFETIQLLVDSSMNPEYVVLTDYNEAILIINVTNPSSTQNATNVNITITPTPTYGTITTTNTTWYYNISVLENGTSKIVKWILQASGFTRGDTVYITINVTSDNFGTTTSRTKLLVFTEKFVIFDNYHTGYFSATKMSGLISMANTIFNYNVYLCNTTLDSNLLGNATLLIIPDIETNFTESEFGLIKDYLDNGGGLLIMGNIQTDGYTYFPDWQMDAYNNITGRFGIQWNMGEAMDDTNNFMGKPWQINLTSSAFGTGPIATSLLHGSSYVLYISGTFLNISDGAEVILHGNPGTTYAVDPDGNNLNLSAEDIILMAGLYNETTGTKIIAIGSSKIFYDGWPYPLNYENNILLRRTLQWFRYYPDTVAPSISITSPADGEWFTTSTVTIFWTGSDDNYLEYYEVYKNNSLVAHLDASVNSIDLTLADGHWIVTVKGIDWAGNEASDSITIHVDTTSPQVSITSPSNDTWVNTSHVTIEWTASDATGLSKVEVYVDGQLNQTLSPTATSVTVNLSDGTHVIKVVVYDNVDNTAEDEIYVHVDTAPPVISITSPANGTWFNTGTVTIVWSITEENLDRVEVYVDGSLVSTVSPGRNNVTLPLTDGLRIIEVRAYDKAGNVDSDTVGVYVDTTSPQVSITSPSDGEKFVVGSNVTIEWNISDNLGVATVRLYINGTLKYECNGSGTYTITFSETGHYVITVEAVDNAGNTAMDSITIEITEKTTAPPPTTTPTTTTPAPAVGLLTLAAVAIVGVGVLIAVAILVLRKKRE